MGRAIRLPVSGMTENKVVSRVKWLREWLWSHSGMYTDLPCAESEEGGKLTPPRSRHMWRSSGSQQGCTEGARATDAEAAGSHFVPREPGLVLFPELLYVTLVKLPSLSLMCFPHEGSQWEENRKCLPPTHTKCCYHDLHHFGSREPPVNMFPRAPRWAFPEASYPGRKFRRLECIPCKQKSLTTTIPEEEFLELGLR